VAHGLKKGQSLVLVKDAYLYCYLGKDYSIIPTTGYSFSVQEFQRNPELGIIDKQAKIFVDRVIPKGTMVQLTDIRWTSDWNTGGLNNYYGRILSGAAASDKEVMITHILFKHWSERTDDYAIPTK